VQAQPKIDQLKTLLADHMARHVRARKSTRTMVFCNQRDTVMEIVRQLELMAEEAASCCGEGRTVHGAVSVAAGTDLGLANVSRGDWAGAAVVRAHAFIGQAKTSSGAGLNQEQQARVLERFHRYEILFYRNALMCSV
jgi:ERCC4-related helicase